MEIESQQPSLSHDESMIQSHEDNKKELDELFQINFLISVSPIQNYASLNNILLSKTYNYLS